MKRKVDLERLEILARQKVSGAEIAKALNVSPGAISKNLKALNFACTKDVTLRAATKINDRKLNAMARLERIAKGIEDELSYVENTMKTTSGEERREWEGNHIKYNAEVRKQISLLREIALTLYNVEEVEAFKKIVIEEIGGCDEEIRRKILDRIRQRRTDTGLSGISSLGI